MTKRFLSTGTLLVVLGLALVSLPSPSPAQHEEEIQVSTAVCVVRPTKGYKVRGTILLRQVDGEVHLTGQVRNLTPGPHGFHIHEFGDLRDPMGESAGGHYNPGGHQHGGPDTPERHAGDLGNIEADEGGVARIDVRTKGFKLHYVLGRTIVVHAGKDDLKSQPSGAAGPRAGIGIIGIAQPEKQNGR